MNKETLHRLSTSCLLLGVLVACPATRASSDDASPTRMTLEKQFADGSAEQSRIRAWLDANAASGSRPVKLGNLRVGIAIAVAAGVSPEWARYSPVPRSARDADEVRVLSCAPAQRTEWTFHSKAGTWVEDRFETTATATACDTTQPL